jgi:hypothetical protein
MNILTGNRNARQYVEPDDHRRPYSIRPAYRPEPRNEEPKRLAEGILTWIVFPAAFWAFVAWFVHILMLSVR